LRAQLHVLLDRLLVEQQRLLQLRVLAAELLVLRLRVDQPVRPAGGVAERPGDAVRGDPNGLRIDAPVPCTPSSALERNETVIRTSAASTRMPTMIRRRTALERFEGYPEVAAFWTEEPSTATRAVRLRATTRPSVDDLSES
jgi:hypothetical protein